MRQISSTQAKQSFGDLLKAAAIEPVAIEKHRKVQAILASPAFFAQTSESERKLAARRLARSQQEVVERDRLIKHHRIALDLLVLPAKARNELVAKARATVQRWRDHDLCSADYIERWSALLSLPVREMAMAITSDADGWGTALRQNSPWVGIRS